MANVKTTPQDMPPAGGYSSITYERIFLKKFFKRSVALAFFVWGVGCVGYYYSYRFKFRTLAEINGARNVLFATLVAERDRAYLKQIRKNRDFEREVMKNVPNWVVGTYYGEPIYKTLVDKYRREDCKEVFSFTDLYSYLYLNHRYTIYGGTPWRF
ncbi:PREDICTED: NADH dehydrogenase [ubiquinone] 1 alpha subcomplex subunit 13 [Ceratosolen solmsi marchali]|uniref:NADH dehydrogenase [ubiquinone] 1 alpha subcomplex subunit 13 n=1 Tax=Ceratosolen solmsi marchali TaxID=326594 RepID=A0AAJ6VLT1_9HYME|nr:PREDICTED: NADH dehydrogenase [ubiquinone] 1 alpha subcomplex subunit 13 [Ceratosolen solmsi marchali]